MIYKLEDRVLFDAALPVDVAEMVSDDVAATDAEQQGAESQEDVSNATAEESSSQELSHLVEKVTEGYAEVEISNEVYIIDASVENYEQLIDALPEGAECLILEPGDDIADLAESLEQFDDLDAIHILSHGDDGKLMLGSTEFSSENLSLYTDLFTSMGESLADNGDILFYGCNVAETADGEAFVQKIGQLTGADIAASNDNTGAANFLANWELEFTTGSIESLQFTDQAYSRIMGVVTVNDVDGDSNAGVGDGTQDISLAAGTSLQFELSEDIDADSQYRIEKAFKLSADYDSDLSFSWTDNSTLVVSAGGDGVLFDRDVVTHVSDANGENTQTLTLVDTDGTVKMMDAGNTNLQGKVNSISGSDDDTIILFAEDYGTKTINLSKKIDVAGRNLSIVAGINDITINNSGYSDVDGNLVKDRLFAMRNGASLHLDGFTLQNGKASSGSAIYADGQDLVRLVDTTLQNNTATNNGAIYARGLGELTIINSTFTNNAADGYGGVIFAQKSDSHATNIEIVDSTFSNNTAGSNGGAISMNSTNGTLTIYGSTFDNNQVTSGYGGALMFTNASGTATIKNSTFYHNDSSSTGKVFRIHGGSVSVSIDHCTIADNGLGSNDYLDISAGAGQVRISNSIIYDGLHEDTTKDEDGVEVDPNRIISLGNNIIKYKWHSISTSTGDVTGNNVSEAIFAGNKVTLADNGGPVKTIAISNLGSAYNGGNSSISGTPIIDARGMARYGASDIGSFESYADNTDGVVTKEDLQTHGTLEDALIAEIAGVSNDGDATDVDTITFHSDLLTLDGDNNDSTLTIDMTKTISISSALNISIDGDIEGDGKGDVIFDGGALKNSSVAGDNLVVGTDADTNRFFTNEGTLELKHLTLQNNISAHGAGVRQNGGSLTLDAVYATNLVNENWRGGGVYATGGLVNVYNSTFEDNMAKYKGGALSIQNGTTAVIKNSTFYQNWSKEAGGAIYIENAATEVTILNSTVADNRSETWGGVVHVNGGTLNIGNSLLADNFATRHNYRTDIGWDNSDNINSLGNNIIEYYHNGVTHGDVFNGYGDVIGNRSDLWAGGTATLADNGGPVKTIAIAENGTAYDSGNGGIAGSPTSDARGVLHQGTADIGAYEFDKAPTVAITLNDTALKIGDTATVTFTFSEVPTGFTVDDVTVDNGSLSNLKVTSNPLVYTATFTPTVSVEDVENTINVGSGLTDPTGNAGVAASSDNYVIDTLAPGLAAEDGLSVTEVDVDTAAEISGTGTDGDTVVIYINSTEVATVTVAQGTWSYDLTTSSAGTFNIQTALRDSAGNTGTLSDGETLIVNAAEVSTVVVDSATDSPAETAATGSDVQAEPVEAGLQDSILDVETDIRTDVELYTGQPESVEQAMEQVVEQIGKTLSHSDSLESEFVSVQTLSHSLSSSNTLTGNDSNSTVYSDRILSMEDFKQLDTDTNNSLSVDELNDRFENIDFNKADLNEDGKIDEDEFQEMLKNLLDDTAQSLDSGEHTLGFASYPALNAHNNFVNKLRELCMSDI